MINFTHVIITHPLPKRQNVIIVDDMLHESDLLHPHPVRVHLSSRLSYQIFSQSLATKLKVLHDQKSSEQYQHPSELAEKNHQRRFQV